MSAANEWNVVFATRTKTIYPRRGCLHVLWVKWANLWANESASAWNRQIAFKPSTLGNFDWQIIYIRCPFLVLSRDMAIYSYFGLSIRTFEVTIISIVKFLITCLVSEILKDKKGQRHHRRPRRTLCYGLLLYIFLKNFKICAKMYILIKFTCLVCSLSISRLFSLSRLAVLMSTQCRPFST